MNIEGDPCIRVAHSEITVLLGSNDEPLMCGPRSQEESDRIAQAVIALLPSKSNEYRHGAFRTL